jgi:hypothetical protein
MSYIDNNIYVTLPGFEPGTSGFVVWTSEAAGRASRPSNIPRHIAPLIKKGCKSKYSAKKKAP